jgi:hypothetical protein
MAVSLRPYPRMKPIRIGVEDIVLLMVGVFCASTSVIWIKPENGF